MQEKYLNPVKIILPDSNGFTILEKKEIIKLVANGNCTDIYLVGNRKLTYCMTLKEFDKLLKPYECFCRIHRSSIVNLDHVKAFSNEGIIELAEEQVAHCSDSIKEEFISYFKHP
ncbi:MAG: LytTR family transcriptional regulator DNA-binding domain-containing protein [Bacteroidetes bacterium]|nr:LytTR family transcriptional regulator DNA-binding domain-containing protein [Bacteroidota bacterium]